MAFVLVFLALLFGHAEPVSTSATLPTCAAGDLTARSLVGDGPAGGTFYSSLVVTNRGADCALADGGLVATVGGHSAGLVVTGRSPQARLPADGTVRLFVSTQIGRCFLAARGPSLPLALSAGGRSVPVTGAGVASGYVCGRLVLTEAAPPARPSR